MNNIPVYLILLLVIVLLFFLVTHSNYNENFWAAYPRRRFWGWGPRFRRRYWW